MTDTQELYKCTACKTSDVRVVSDAIEAAVMHMNEEKWFNSEGERRLFYRFAALIRRHIERELHTGIDITKGVEVGGD